MDAILHHFPIQPSTFVNLFEKFSFQPIFGEFLPRWFDSRFNSYTRKKKLKDLHKSILENLQICIGSIVKDRGENMVIFSSSNRFKERCRMRGEGRMGGL